MTIRDYIRNEVFAKRAQERGCLVVYDPERRYREIAQSMASEQCCVVDASTSVIVQREAAVDAFTRLAAGSIQQLLIWVPAARPVDDEARQRDPFGVFGLVGREFPVGDGDEYISLCRCAKPDHIPEVNRLFQEGTPSFEVIDALDQGGAWPKLKTLLQSSSSKEILLGLLLPKPHLEEALRRDTTWIGEAREFVLRSLGHRLKTRGQTQQSLGEELWRLLLFSEFVFDSSGVLPAALETVPRIGPEARGLVFDVCDELRHHDDYKDAYLTRAAAVERELQLPERSVGVTDLGQRDTFPFEERFFLKRLVAHALKGELQAAWTVWQSRQKSIWLRQSDRLAEWSLAGRALDLLSIISEQSPPKFSGLEALLHAYARTWRELDRSHREMEQAINLWSGDHDGLDELVSRARGEYFRVVEGLQAQFVRLVEAEGWPITGGPLLSNAQVFSKVVAPALEGGERVAYFLVDSLRYELGVELQKQLSEKHQVMLQPVCAQLPTYTEVGMASLMPEAESSLKLAAKDGKLVTTLGGKEATTPSARLAYLQSHKGDQCGEVRLDELTRKKKFKVPEQVRLLLVRTSDIDTIAHDTPHQVLEMFPSLLRQIISGVSKVADLGFDRAVLVTDHGFLLFHEQAAGNLAPKPDGTWLTQKSRCLLGRGHGDSANLLLKRDHVGIPGDFQHFAAPRTLVPYERGHIYCHEGLSLQECVLPCISVRLTPTDKKPAASPAKNLTLSYRQGKTDSITTRRPVLDLSWPKSGLFAEGEIEVAIEAVDSKGTVVGWVSSGQSQSVNLATGGVRISQGESLAVGLRMDDKFTGSFTVRVLDPVTNAQVADLSLKTSYLE